MVRQDRSVCRTARQNLTGTKAERQHADDVCAVFMCKLSSRQSSTVS